MNGEQNLIEEPYPKEPPEEKPSLPERAVEAGREGVEAYRDIKKLKESAEQLKKARAAQKAVQAGAQAAKEAGEAAAKKAAGQLGKEAIKAGAKVAAKEGAKAGAKAAVATAGGAATGGVATAAVAAEEVLERAGKVLLRVINWIPGVKGALNTVWQAKWLIIIFLIFLWLMGPLLAFAAGLSVSETGEAAQEPKYIEFENLQEVVDAMKAEGVVSGLTARWSNKYLTTLKEVPFWNGHSVETMEITVNRAVASDVRAIFEELAKIHFRIYPKETHGWRPTQGAGSTRAPSAHLFGLAIDINPHCNPYFPKGGKRPTPSKARGVITDEVVEIFARHGFSWGGHWRRSKDYMHFSVTKGLRGVLQ